MSSKASDQSDMRDEYDFSAGTRGRYAERFAAGTNVVVLDPDVAEAFSDSKSVNEALRGLLKLAKQQANKASTEPAD